MSVVALAVAETPAAELHGREHRTLVVLGGDDVDRGPGDARAVRREAADVDLAGGRAVLPEEGAGRAGGVGVADDLTAVAAALRERVGLPSRTRYRLAGVGLDSMRDALEYGMTMPSGYIPSWPRDLILPLCFALMAIAYLSHLLAVLRRR